MSYAQLQNQVRNQTGGWVQSDQFLPAQTEEWSGWQGLWSVLSTPCFMAAGGTTAASVVIYFDALPIVNKSPNAMDGATKKMLETIDFVFGPSKSEMARILNVSRPMVYHYGAGMEPDFENRTRLKAVADVASEFRWVLGQPLKGLLKAEQPEGRTLLDFLSEENLDIPGVRRIAGRSIKESDKALRNRFAEAMIKGQTSDERLDIVRERHKAGRAVIVGDPEAPGKVIQVQPNGRRVRGRMEKRRFIPDEE